MTNMLQVIIAQPTGGMFMDVLAAVTEFCHAKRAHFHRTHNVATSTAAVRRLYTAFDTLSALAALLLNDAFDNHRGLPIMIERTPDSAIDHLKKAEHIFSPSYRSITQSLAVMQWERTR